MSKRIDLTDPSINRKKAFYVDRLYSCYLFGSNYSGIEQRLAINLERNEIPDVGNRVLVLNSGKEASMFTVKDIQKDRYRVDGAEGQTGWLKKFNRTIFKYSVMEHGNMDNFAFLDNKTMNLGDAIRVNEAIIKIGKHQRQSKLAKNDGEMLLW